MVIKQRPDLTGRQTKASMLSHGGANA